MSDETNAVELATELTIAWLSNPNTRVDVKDVPAFLSSMHSAVLGLSVTAEVPAAPEAAPEHVPAVSVRKSLADPAHILSMIDGKPYKALRRHLSTHGLTPDEYRARYGLKADYPMVAPDYSASRRAMAKKIGLGRKPGETRQAAAAPQTSAAMEAPAAEAPAPKRRGRAKAAVEA